MPMEALTCAYVLASTKCTSCCERNAGPPVIAPPPAGSSGSTSVTSLGPKPNGSDTRLSLPPVTDELTPVARLAAPPAMEAKAFGCPALSPQMASKEAPPEPVRFPQPPLIDV